MRKLLTKKLTLISAVCAVSIGGGWLTPSVKAQGNQAAFWGEVRGLTQQAAEQYEAKQYVETVATTTELISKLEAELGDYSSAVLPFRRLLFKAYGEMGDQGRALIALADAVYRQEVVLGADHPDVIEGIRELGMQYWQAGDYAEALPLFERSLTTIGSGSSINAFGRSSGSESLGALSQTEQDYAATLSAADRSLLINRAILDEKQLRTALDIAEFEDVQISNHLQNAIADKDAAALALSFIFRYKGYLLDKTANISQQLWQPPVPEGQRLQADLQSLRSVLHTLSITDTSDISAEQYITELSAIESKAAEMSLQLSSQNVAEQAFSPISVASIQRQIPVDAALIEIVRYQPKHADGSENSSASDRYVAYVLSQQGITGAVDLGEAAAIDNLTIQLRQSLVARSASVKDSAHQLYQTLIAPLDTLLSGQDHLIISPDSQLNLVPFEALVDSQNRYLVESYQISYVSSGRDLLRLQSSRPSRQKPVIIANPDYDSSPSERSSSADDNSLYSINSMPAFSPLPGTLTEAEAIVPLMPEATVLTGAAATEGQLNRLQGPSLLHIATHGFFLSDAIAPNPNSLIRGASFDLVDTESATNTELQNSASPLYNSGLVLAGANKRTSQTEDGILTAMEAVGLDLHGTQLVVLSACETGVGSVSDGEGVYGLRRAFAIAGAESQLMSLWQVDDTGTSELMQLYYQNLIENGQGRSEALRNAQLALLNTGTYGHPYYWSSFIFSGDWKPLE